MENNRIDIFSWRGWEYLDYKTIKKARIGNIEYYQLLGNELDLIKIKKYFNFIGLPFTNIGKINQTQLQLYIWDSRPTLAAVHITFRHELKEALTMLNLIGVYYDGLDKTQD